MRCGGPEHEGAACTTPECCGEAGTVLTSSGDPRNKHAVTPRSPWHLGLLVSGDPGRRNRRPIDVVLFASAALAAVFAAMIAKSASNEDESISRALVAVLGLVALASRTPCFSSRRAGVVADTLRWP